MKNLIVSSFIICAIIMLSACSGNNEDKNKKEPGVSSFSNDLENAGWINQNTLTKEVAAHSGKFSSKLDSVSQYSFGFVNYFKYINDTLPEKVDINFWIFYPQTGIESNLVISIDSVGKNIFWKGIPLKDSVKSPKQWKEIKSDIILPREIMFTDKVSVYIWNNDKRTFYIDDIKVGFGKK